jgi:ribose/xylose/arabinose/galactoside ABC-type transport system permease subunit
MSEFAVSAPAVSPRRSAIGRRAVMPYLVWEAILVPVVVVLFFLASLRGSIFHGPGLWYSIAEIGFLASGLALSLRTGTPNLAVPTIAGAAGAGYAKLAVNGWPAIVALLLALLAAVVFGLVLGLVTGVTGLPGWAVSLAGLAVAQAVTFELTNGTTLLVPGSAVLSSGTGLVWALLFLLVSVGGGALWLVPAVQTMLVAVGPDGQRERRLGGRLPGALAGFVGSCLLAAVGGIIAVGYLRAASPASVMNLSLVFAAVLIGGASLFGTRAGVAGTFLGVLALAATERALVMQDASFWVRELVYGLAILFGLFVGWVLDLLSSGQRAPDQALLSYP